MNPTQTTRIPSGFDAIESSRVLAQSKIDDIRETGRTVVISGWMLLPDGPPDGIVVRNENARAWDAKMSPRPDLAAAFPSIPNAAAAGFIAEVPAESFRVQDDLLLFTLIGLRGENPVARRRVAFTPIEFDEPVSPPPGSDAAADPQAPKVFPIRGRILADDLQMAVATHRDPASVKSVLQWQCGADSLPRQLRRDFPNAVIHGVDVDETLVAGLQAMVPEGVFRTVSPTPPLPFDDASFDLVFAHTLFDRLEPAAQQAWLAELARVLEPSGLLVVDTFGPHASRLLLDAPARAILDSAGFYNGSDPTAAGPESAARASYEGPAFFTPAFVRAEWTSDGRFSCFESIEGGLEGAKDLHLLVRGLAS